MLSNSAILLERLSKFAGSPERLKKAIQQLKNLGYPKYLRAPIYLLWEITYKCNLRCVYCFNACPRSVNELSNEKLLDVADQIARMKVLSVCLSGGEPFLRWKTYIELAHYLAEHDVRVGTVTDGWYVTEKHAKELAKYINEVQISIDGSRPDVHDRVRGVPGSFEKAVKATRLFKKVGIAVDVGTSLTRFNIEDFPNIVALSRKLQAKSLRTQPLHISGRAFLNDVKPTTLQYRSLERYIGNYRRNKSRMKSLPIVYRDPTIDIRVGALVGFTTGIGITPDGFLTICPLLPFEMGNLHEQTLDEAWRKGLRVAWKHPKLKKIVLKIKNIEDVPIATGGLVYGVSGLSHLNPNEIVEEDQEH
jgi:MoaA/NifB/PqqE/SkfB family radical SAM enzyme